MWHFQTFSVLSARSIGFLSNLNTKCEKNLKFSNFFHKFLKCFFLFYQSGKCDRWAKKFAYRKWKTVENLYEFVV